MPDDGTASAASCFKQAHCHLPTPHNIPWRLDTCPSMSHLPHTCTALPHLPYSRVLLEPLLPELRWRHARLLRLRRLRGPEEATAIQKAGLKVRR